MNDYLIGIFKEVGKKPTLIKINNKKEYVEMLLEGEVSKFEYDDYVVLYKTNNECLLANIYLNTFSYVGLTIKGNIFVVSKDSNNNLISLNKGQFMRATNMLLRQQINYKKFDENGRFIPKNKRNNKNNKKNNEKFNLNENTNKNDDKQDCQNKIVINVSGEELKHFLNNFVLIIQESIQKRLNNSSE